MSAEQRCLVCGEAARHKLGIRCRYGRQGDADWAPDLGAFLCERHARDGCEIEINFRPATDGRVRTTTNGPLGSYQSALIIGTRLKEPPGQGTLL